MNKKILIFISVIGLLFYACQTTSKIQASAIHPGMSKQEVIKQLGKPYKTSFYLSEDSTFYETLYYKELLVKVTGQSSLISALKFKNNSLISLNQSREHELDGSNHGFYPSSDKL